MERKKDVCELCFNNYALEWVETERGVRFFIGCPKCGGKVKDRVEQERFNDVSLSRPYPFGNE
jgi:PHP family Zn ribbon phosphoesterase